MTDDDDFTEDELNAQRVKFIDQQQKVMMLAMLTGASDMEVCLDAMFDLGVAFALRHPEEAASFNYFSDHVLEGRIAEEGIAKRNEIVDVLASLKNPETGRYIYRRASPEERRANAARYN